MVTNTGSARMRILSSIAIGIFLLVTSQAAMAQWSGSTDVYKTNTAGNVGIGTQTPDIYAKLHVYNPPNAGVDIQSADTAGWSRLRLVTRTHTYGWFAGDSSAGDAPNKIGLYDYTNGAFRMMIDSAGNVGIGTTNPVFDTNAGAKYLMLDGGSGGPGEIGTGSNTNGAANHVGQFSFLNTNLSGSDKRIALIAGLTDGAINSGRLDFYAKNAGSFSSPTMSVNSSSVNVTGNFNATGTITGGNIVAKYQDVAEWVPSSERLSAGTVVVLDPTRSNQVIASTQAYDTRVAGVISAQPGITLGEKSDEKVLVATTGRVRVMVDATKAPINIGDLLVTSDVPGVAMKSEAVNIGGVSIHRPGTIIGKALEPLAKGKGEILVLLSLQ